MAAATFVALAMPSSPALANAEGVKVGVITAVNPETRGQSQKRQVRVLDLGSDVLFNERITTSNEGQAQIFFLDQSSLSIGSNSEVVIDKFVYDPDRQASTLALGVGEGLLRYVGGRISKQVDVTFATPTATIGVRGGIALIDVAPDGATRATFLYGEHMTVTAGGKTEVVLRPGYSVSVDKLGQPPSSPTKVAEEELTKANHSLERKIPMPTAIGKNGDTNDPARSSATRARVAVTSQEALVGKALSDKVIKLEQLIVRAAVENVNVVERLAHVGKAAQERAKRRVRLHNRGI